MLNPQEWENKLFSDERTDPSKLEIFNATWVLRKPHSFHLTSKEFSSRTKLKMQNSYLFDLQMPSLQLQGQMSQKKFLSHIMFLHLTN